MKVIATHESIATKGYLLMALRFISLPRSNWVALGAKADINRQAEPAGLVANDPKGTWPLTAKPAK
jgi:hypothetical protein